MNPAPSKYSTIRIKGTVLFFQRSILFLYCNKKQNRPRYFRFEELNTKEGAG